MCQVMKMGDAPLDFSGVILSVWPGLTEVSRDRKFCVKSRRLVLRGCGLGPGSDAHSTIRHF
jgi:hypothetical protein